MEEWPLAKPRGAWVGMWGHAAPLQPQTFLDHEPGYGTHTSSYGAQVSALIASSWLAMFH